MGELRERFWELPLEALDRAAWEALCDGCGRCCLHKLEDEDTGEVVETNVACRLLDPMNARCSPRCSKATSRRPTTGSGAKGAGSTRRSGNRYHVLTLSRL